MNPNIPAQNLNMITTTSTLQNNATTFNTTLECASIFPLPESYSPSVFSVVIGHGGPTKGKNRLRMIAAQCLDKYEQADKMEKSVILTDIIEKVREGCPYGDTFIRFANEGGGKLMAQKPVNT